MKRRLFEGVHIVIPVFFAGIFPFHATPGWAALVAVAFGMASVVAVYIGDVISAVLYERNDRIVREREARRNQ